MKTIVEPLEGNKVKVSVEVDEEEFERSLDTAFRKIAREVRIPGFRPGKAPRRIIEARLGAGAGRVEALRDSLPDYYAQALQEHGVDAIAPPEIDITAGEDAGPVAFDAVVEVRPQLKLAGYQGLRVNVPSPLVGDADVEAQIDRLRANFGELSPVDRPARDGDNLTIDLAARRDGEPVAGLSADDFLYELGSASVLPELDDRLRGAKPGDILAFDAELLDGPVSLQVLVKDVKEKILPAASDQWASEASELDTVEELRADIRERLQAVRKVEGLYAWRNGTLEALVELVDIDAPEPLVQAELERRAHDFAHRLEAQGVSISRYLQATGQDEQQVVAGLRSEAVPAVKADLALRSVADAEGIDVTDEEVDAEIERLATAYGQKPAALRSKLQRAGQMPAVRSDLKKSKALEWLVEHVELVDPDGQPVDRSLLSPEVPGEAEPAEQAPTAAPESGEA